MIIKEVELNNFRIYKGISIIPFKPDSLKNICIISGQNGFGKTTFLMSLVWCLYGKQMQDVDDLYYKEIADQGGYNKYIANSLNRLSKNEGETKFHVAVTFSKLNIPDLPCTEIKITRSFDIFTNTNDQVEILIDGHPNELANEVGPEFFIRDYILPKEIAKFFFFDAEKIVTLAEINTAEQRRKLSEAYSEVLGIKKYEDLKNQLEELQIKLRQESASQKEKQLLIDLNAEEEKCDLTIKENEIQIRQLKDDLQFKRKESSDIQGKLIRAGSVISIEELNDLRTKETTLNSRLEKLQNELKDSFEVIPFAIAGELFQEVSDQLEVEVNIRKIKFQQENINETTNKVLNELFNFPRPPELLIDHRIHDFYSELFKKLIIKHFFGDTPDIPDGFFAIHDYSEAEQNELNALLNNIKLSFKEAFKRINGDVNQIRNELGIIRRRLRDADANKEDYVISSLRERKAKLDNEIFRIEETIDDLNIEIGERTNEKTQILKRKLEIAKKIEVSEKNREKDELITDKINRLRDFINTFKEQKKRSLEKQILHGLEVLMHKRDFITNVRVDIVAEDVDIVLFNSRGEEIKKETLSKGEQQMYATALLRGLVEESEIEFPVFIDSPMQKFDEKHAENIVKYFYPNASEQVVIFPLVNKELNVKEFNILSKYICQTILIDNINTDKSEFMEVEPSEFLGTYNQLYNNAL